MASGTALRIGGRNLRWERTPDYDADSLRVWNKSVGFLRDPEFNAAYSRGMMSGHRIGGSVDTDLHIEWRLHTALWAAKHAVSLPGAFVECGVNTGMMSVAICHYLNFNTLDKDFFLFDTFCGIPEQQATKSESGNGVRILKMNQMYEDCYEIAQRNFADFKRAHLVRGMVPETLTTVSIDRVAYLSIDMNIVYPEIAAIEYFWEKLSPGAIVLLDDYGWKGHVAQKQAMDQFASDRGTSVLELPTGQGVIIRTP